MLLSTAGIIDNEKYAVIGIVTGLSIRSLSFFRQFLGSLSSVLGGRQDWTGIEEKVAQARVEAIEEMIAKAKQMGADDVVAIHINMSEIGAGHNDAFLVCSASGTAVRLLKK